MLLASCGGGDSRPGSQADASGEDRRSALAVASGVELVLTPVAATASGFERADLGPSAAIDGDEGTRWSSSFSDNQHLTLDLGKSSSIDKVRISWERAHATQYLLQTSEDASSWTTVRAVDNSQGGIEEWSGLAARGRYLRVQGIRRSSQYGYSIFEIQVFGGTTSAPAPAPSPSPSPTPAPAPAPSPEPPSPDLGKPGVAVKPVAATSSLLENPGMPAALAVDGNPATRWASAFENGAWIQFDFGVRTAIGYMRLSWEAAHAKEYMLQASDDGKTWTRLRHVSNSTGGTEEFFNLNATARFIRMQGVQRATPYGYSLFEASFKTPGSDNTLFPMATSAFRFPGNGAHLAPLPTSTEPVEVLQFTLADGSLVTRFGVRGLARHGRERGEEWNEIGYGPNDTIGSGGQPVDKGPGNYLTFVPNYFKNRTWGFEIIDNSRVAGVTKPVLKVNQYFPQQQLPGGVAWFRAFDRPGVTGYGWMAPGQLVDPNSSLCPSVPYPPNGKLASASLLNNGCSLSVASYPGHGALGADGFPNGKSVSARPLAVGDVIEVSPSFFSTREAMAAVGDTGGLRYYANEWVYVVGTGLRPWYGIQPRLNSWPLPQEALSGGEGSVSYNYSDNAAYMFQQPHNHIGMQNMQRFVEGRRVIHTDLFTGDHNEPGNDRYQAVVGLQGPRFNQSTCMGCHVNNGRSPAPLATHQRLDGMSVRVASVDASGQQVPHPIYGAAVQMNARSTSTGTAQDWGTSVRVAGFESTKVKLADGTAVELRKPRIAFDGPAPAAHSLRSAQPMIGMGLLEAIPEADLLARARTTPDEDGVKGTPNFVFDPESGAVRLGRFGWKASKASLRHQAAAALLFDMSVTSPVYPNRDCLAGPANCTSAKVERGISESDLQSVTRYLALLAVPAQRNQSSGFPRGVAPLPELDVKPDQIAAGAKVFQALRCVACHTSEMKTGGGYPFAEARNQTIRPYTDLLLHDMGPGLADGIVEGRASGSMWRTPPLWGLGYTERVAGSGVRTGYLHDGRARNLTEAILWHGGEAEKAKQRFSTLSLADRQAVLAFLQSL